MSGNSIHAIGSWIVNFAAQPGFTLGARVHSRITEITELAATFFRGRNSRFQCWARTKTGVRHSQRYKDVLPCKLVQRHAANTRDDFAERDETDVAVSETRAGRITQRFFDQPFDCFVVADPTFAQIEIRCVTADVSQQLLDA
jgi:hypothetical protein